MTNTLRSTQSHYGCRGCDCALLTDAHLHAVVIHIYCVLHTIPLFPNCVSHTVKIYYFTVCKCAHAATNAISNPVNHVSSRLTQEKFSSTTPRSDEDMNSLVNCLPSHIHAVLEGQVGHKFWGVYSARAMAVLQAPSDQVYAAFTESADHLKRCQLSKQYKRANDQRTRSLDNPETVS